MEVKTSFESVDYRVFETDSFIFKIRDESLNKLKEKKKFKQIIRSKLIKSLRPKIDNVTGTEWQQSLDLIFSELTKEE